MSIERRPRGTMVGAALLTLGGVLAFVSGSLHWASLTFPRTQAMEVTVHVGHRNIAFFMGALMILRAALTLSLKRPESSRTWGGIAFITGGILGGYAVFDLATERSRALSILATNTARSFNSPVEQVRAVIDRQVAEGTVRFAFTPGIYLALVAAVLAIWGSVLILRSTTGAYGPAGVVLASSPNPFAAGPPPPIPPPPGAADDSATGSALPPGPSSPG
jgi:hypothetical protein